MKQKKNDMVDRAEIIDDPSKRYEELKKIDLDLNSILEIQKNLSTTFNQIQSELKSIYGNVEIYVTQISENESFLSNGKDKGFLLKKKKLVGSFEYPKNYCDFVNSFGMVQDLTGFKNEYLENLRNIFFEENEEIGICFWLEKFLKKSDNKKTFGELNIDKIKIFGEEANGNLFLIDSLGKVYLYANDHNYKNINLIDGCPKNTFYICKGKETIDSFYHMFFEDFCN